jgi:two-component system nitrate/nitrite response regulator NarL
MPEGFRAVIIDEQPLFRDGVAAALSAFFKNAVIEQGSGGNQAVQYAQTRAPHILLLGINEPSEAVSATQAISAACQAVKVIYFTGIGSEAAIQDVLRAGARGCVSRVVTAVELIRCIKAVHLGESYVSPGLAASLLRRPPPRNQLGSRNETLSALTGREQKIMQEVALGLTNKEIASKLLLSDNTVKRYMTQIMQKLHVRNRLEAVLVLRTSGLLGATNPASLGGNGANARRP